ncbi:MAG: GtrA family protein [Caldilineaceae bacterium]
MKVADSLGLASQHRAEAKRFIKFATVGVAGAVTHFSIVNILVQLVGISEQMANPFGFIAAVLQNFLLNRRWTFPESRQRNAGLQLAQFAIVSVVGLVVNQFVFTTIHRLLEQTWIQLVGQQRLGHALSYNFALAVAIGVVLFWNFAINRLWTYRGLSKLSSEPST